QQGQQVYVEGKIRYRQYDNKQGEKRYVTEIIADNIVLLKNGQQQPVQPQQPQYQQPQYQQPYAGGYGQNEPDLPY
ncbi:MAG: single-stranded DNA-binding protein, partial [Muribaculaceae bacterium]|nr:single-stranded DNA-binding protein [Muribaculaceae bacterium]